MKELEDKIVTMLKSIYDPEIPVDIFELGLIYEVKIDKENNVQIEMTLTSPNCPVAETLPKEVEDKVSAIEEVTTCKVNIVFDPPWDKDMMSEEAKLELGFLSCGDLGSVEIQKLSPDGLVCDNGSEKLLHSSPECHILYK
jgi:FeS assembly SUF system protein